MKTRKRIRDLHFREKEMRSKESEENLKGKAFRELSKVVASCPSDIEYCRRSTRENELMFSSFDLAFDLNL